MTGNRITYSALAIVILLLALSFWRLDIDPPLFYVGHSQAQITDPYHLTFAAKNAVQKGDWNPNDFHRWDVFKYSLVSGVSYVVFSLFGVSRTTANIVAIILHLGGFFFLLLGLAKTRPREELLAVSVILLFNSSLFFFGRLPFLENGLIFLSGLTFWLFAGYHDKTWGQFLCGFVVAVAALSGKLFGLILLGPVTLTILYIYRKRSAVPVAIVLAGLAVGLILQIVLFYGGDPSNLLRYYSEQTVGMYGGPPGFSSVVNFIVMLVSYGAESSFWRFTPFFLGLALVSLLTVSLTFPKEKQASPEFVPIVFLLAWFLCGVAGLMPFQYRPIRYGLFLLLPLSGLCGYVVAMTFSQRIRLRLHSKALTLPFLFLFLWYGMTQYWTLTGTGPQLFERAALAMPPAAMLSVLITALVYLLLHRKTRTMPVNITRVVVGVLMAGYLVTQGTYLYQGLVKPGKYLRDANHELPMIIGNGAMLTGPYMPALTIDNELGGVIYMFGLSNIQRDLFEKFNITHIAADNTNWKAAVKDFPFLKNSSIILQVFTRDRAINIIRLASAKTEPTDLERASIFLDANRPDSALFYISRFHQNHPRSLFGSMNLTVALLANKRADEAISLMETMSVENPDNYMIHLFCQVNYDRLYSQTGDPRFRDKSRFHKARASELNPVLPPVSG